MLDADLAAIYGKEKDEGERQKDKVRNFSLLPYPSSFLLSPFSFLPHPFLEEAGIDRGRNPNRREKAEMKKQKTRGASQRIPRALTTCSP
jgi:hypothetical protein